MDSNASSPPDWGSGEHDQAMEITTGSSAPTSSGGTTVGIVEDAENEILAQLARSGAPLHPWTVLRPIIERRLLKTLDSMRERSNVPIKDDEYVARTAYIVNLLRSFDEAPFTIQRLSEVVLRPNEHYKNIDAILHGLEAILSVTSTVPVASPEDIAKLELEYQRIVRSGFPADSVRVPLRRSDTVEMDIES